MASDSLIARLRLPSCPTNMSSHAEPLQPLHDFLLAPEAWLRRATEEVQALARAEAEDGGLLPIEDTAARLAEEPSVARANHVWLQEHRSASAGRGAGTGNGAGQQLALATYNRLVMECPTCGGFISLTQWRQAARTSGAGSRTACRSRQCSVGRFRVTEYKRAQLTIARGVEQGTRLLVRRPASAQVRVVTVAARRHALAAAKAMCSRHN